MKKNENLSLIMNQVVTISTHRVNRGLSLKQLLDLIQTYEIPEDDQTKVTFNIRGVNY